ncbi:MAG: hypothetical protein HC936_13510 [Leptolyngbyaceae cyanobacterium SU_3_3]|nr:hypothetical protein [Leptolyngbyaceae cyanobacterium SU_3_3]NJR52210.1 hypothetical protein [Leptolyngbyaceae cyanobacterium CSU_1_3]
MIISDLNYLTEIFEINSLVGGVRARANGAAIATPRYGVAVASASASGELTSTYTHTSVNKHTGSGYTTIEAQAQANAFAKTGNQSASYQFDSVAIYVG